MDVLAVDLKLSGHRVRTGERNACASPGQYPVEKAIFEYIIT